MALPYEAWRRYAKQRDDLRREAASPGTLTPELLYCSTAPSRQGEGDEK